MPGTRYVAGIDFAHGPRPYQETLGLSASDASTLRRPGRLERLARSGARPVLLEPTPRREETTLLLTGPKPAVEAAKEALRQLLDRDSAVTMPLHPEDVRSLRKPTRAQVADIESKAGCRLVITKGKGLEGSDPILERHQPQLELYGSTEAQSRALSLLADYCQHLALPEDSGKWLDGFDSTTLGTSLEITQSGSGVMRKEEECSRCPRNCVAAGRGQVRVYGVGSFFALRVLQVRGTRRLSEGFRVGVASEPLDSNLESLCTRPRSSWVVGSGRLRPPRGCPPVADGRASLDGLERGEAVGFLVTSCGEVFVFRRASSAASWTTVLCWDAHIPQPDRCFLLVELAGRVAEVMLADLPPPREHEFRVTSDLVSPP